jgi:HEPN domain-containing protein
MLRDKNTERWIEYTQNDLLVAKSLVEQADYVNRAVLTHCQQSIEKHLKAFALMNGLGLKKIHDIVALGKICELADNRFNRFEKEFAWLNIVYEHKVSG